MSTRTQTGWRSTGYRDGLAAYRDTLENPVNHHPDYVRGFRAAWAARHDAAPAVERILADRERWVRADGHGYDHEGRHIGDTSDDSVTARIRDGLAVQVHARMGWSAVERAVIKARAIHAAIK